MKTAEIMHLTEGDFDNSIARGLVLVDFWAPWCGPCRMLSPVLDELAGLVGDAARIAKVNVDEAPRLAARYQVQGIPLLILFKDGRETQRLVGLQQLPALVNLIRSHASR